MGDLNPKIIVGEGVGGNNPLFCVFRSFGVEYCGDGGVTLKHLVDVVKQEALPQLHTSYFRLTALPFEFLNPVIVVVLL